MARFSPSEAQAAISPTWCWSAFWRNSVSQGRDVDRSWKVAVHVSGWRDVRGTRDVKLEQQFISIRYGDLKNGAPSAVSRSLPLEAIAFIPFCCFLTIPLWLNAFGEDRHRHSADDGVRRRHLHP